MAGARVIFFALTGWGGFRYLMFEEMLGAFMALIFRLKGVGGVQASI